MDLIALNTWFYITIKAICDNIQFLIFNRFTGHHLFWLNYQVYVLGIDSWNVRRHLYYVPFHSQGISLTDV